MSCVSVICFLSGGAKLINKVSGHFSDCKAALARKSQNNQDEAYICCLASSGSIIDLAGLLVWLCAVLRTSSQQQPCMSRVILQKDNASPHPYFSISLAEVEPIGYRHQLCWHAIMPSSVVADGFPIRTRSFGKGLELSLENMIRLSGVLTAEETDGKYCLVGPTTALIPTQIDLEGDIQWHLCRRIARSRFPVFDRSKTSVLSANRFEGERLNADSLFHKLKTRRHFLGWCPSVVFNVGTENSTYTTESANAHSTAKKFRVQNFGVTAGTSGMGIFSFLVSTNFALELNKGQQDQNSDLNFDAILLKTRTLQYIVYDVNEKRAWVLPAICAIFHMVHLRIRRVGFSVQLPYAPLDWNGADATYKVMKAYQALELQVQQVRTKYTLEDAVREIWLGLKSCPLKPAAKSNFNPKSDLYDLFGYEMMDIATVHDPIRLRKSRVERTGGWIHLTKSVALVLICGGIGDAITSSDTATCWLTVPSHDYLLCATTKSLQELSNRAGGTNHQLTEDGGEWDCPGLLFEECDCRSHEACKRLQHIVRDRKARPPPQPLPVKGAVVFGLNKKYDAARQSNKIDRGDQNECSSKSLQLYSVEYRAHNRNSSNRSSSRAASSIYSLGSNPCIDIRLIRQQNERIGVSTNYRVDIRHEGLSRSRGTRLKTCQ